jgi:hypothetical protein
VYFCVIFVGMALKVIIFAAVALAAVNAQIPGFGSCPDYKPVGDFDIKRVSIFCTILVSSAVQLRSANASPRGINLNAMIISKGYYFNPMLSLSTTKIQADSLLALVLLFSITCNLNAAYTNVFYLCLCSSRKVYQFELKIYYSPFNPQP